MNDDDIFFEAIKGEIYLGIIKEKKLGPIYKLFKKRLIKDILDNEPKFPSNSSIENCQCGNPGIFSEHYSNSFDNDIHYNNEEDRQYCYSCWKIFCDAKEKHLQENDM